MLDRAMSFLKAEMESGGAWRYWSKAHPSHSLIPPDIDDTVCCSLVLRQQKVEFTPNTDLILANRNNKGLLYTWFSPRLPAPLNLSYWRIALRTLLNPLAFCLFWTVNESKPDDVDSVVNANALCYLGARQETEPLIRHLCEIIEKDEEQSSDKWHLSPLNLYYSVSRALFMGVQELHKIRELVISKIGALSHPDGMIGTSSLDTALAACALINLQNGGDLLDSAIQHLLNQQREDGAWSRSPLYYGGPKKYFGWGSEELTAGFALEALARYREFTLNERCKT